MAARTWWLVATLGLALGCATARRPPAASTAIAVPFIAQKPGHCGPAALAMLARFHGQETSQEEIGDAIYLPEIKGTLTTELTAYARRYGLWTRQYRGSETDLAQKLAAGIPLIVLGKVGESFHYFVVLADGDPLVVHSDRRPFLQLARPDFLAHWNATGRWTLLVCPPERARWELSAAEHNDLGWYYEQRNDPCMAEVYYHNATERDPENAWYAFNLGNARLAQHLLDGAAEAFRRAMALDPRNADAHNNLAWVYHEQGEQLDEAVQLARRAIELNPRKQAWYLDTLGSLLLKQGKPSEAIAAFEQALAATSANQTSLRTGIAQRLTAARALGEE